MTLLAVAIALAVLQAMAWAIDDPDRTGALRDWQWVALRTLGIHAIVAATYTVWPKRSPGRAGRADA
jgi:hypothetical protein